MKEYPDPRQYIEAYLEQAAQEYGDRLHQSGLEPTPKLMDAMFERALQEAIESYTQEATRVRDYNVKVIIREHRKDMRRLRRPGAGLYLCLPLALLLGMLAWYNFSAGDFILGTLYAAGAVFLGALVLGGLINGAWG